MRILAVATVFVAALLTGASVAVAADVGANDDSAKFEDDAGAALYGRMSELGLRRTVIGVRFVPSEAVVIQDKQLLDRAITSATDAGLRVVLAVYPYPPRELEAGLGSPSMFASYVGVLASIYPQVRQFVIGNEPNQPAFWRPQFDAAGNNLSAASFGPYLAAAYDTLKSVDPEISVVGVGRRRAATIGRPRRTTSDVARPASCARSARGAAGGPHEAVMDAFSFHPYPNEATDPLEAATVAERRLPNLDRLKQAPGTRSTAPGSPRRSTMGSSSTSTRLAGRSTPRAGRLPRPRERARHGRDHASCDLRAADQEAACDPDVASLSFFGFHDDGLRTGFQAASSVPGRQRAASAAAASERRPDAAQGAGYPGAGDRRPRREGRRSVDEAEVTARVAAGEDARARVCPCCVVCTLGARAVPLRSRPRAALAQRRRAGSGGDGRPCRGCRPVRSRGQPHAPYARRASGDPDALSRP
jgi:hypothetical protein